MSDDLHDALRAQGLVPAAEDAHFTACSTDYRQKINAASEGLVDAEDYEMAEAKIEDLEDDVRSLERKVEELETDVADAEASVASFRKETLELRAENTRLTEKLLAIESAAE